jgi:ATP-dependent helicase Lhr and Lhr-like helicase
VTPFERLHPALQHHIVNSLGWKELRQLQEDAIVPLMAGHHALLIGPTAGGKTEAAFFPILSRMLTEEWISTSILYICPLRALLNNLEIRLRDYCALVGHTVALWHGDISQSARQRIAAEPPDCLMITPESLEVILVSHRWNKDRAFGGIRAVIVDEIHAFAGDDRGWHLLALLERINKLAQREVQRIGLSATVGNPRNLLDWLAGPTEGPRTLIDSRDASSSYARVTLDDVGSIENAATVISRLHRGEKRLVFCDSRSEVESLGRRLRSLGVDTYLSHSSLSLEQRKNAETAFASASNCVIVATSTLELGIDIGDLDHVIQVGAPWSASSFVQRLGRTGRRPGSHRNCLFLATTRDSFLRALGITTLFAKGYVEPVEPPAMPFHMLAQQLMALALQQGGIALASWPEWIGRMSGFASLDKNDVERVVKHMLACDILSLSDGRLWFGTKGEARFGRRNFMELLSSFTREPLFTVRYGREHLGSVDRATFMLGDDRPRVLLLGGHSWKVNEIDWNNQVVSVEPTAEEGKSRWLGNGQSLSFDVCQAIKHVIEADPAGSELSKRATATLEKVRAEFSWLKAGESTIVTNGHRTRWWTCAGLMANSTLAGMLRRLCVNLARTDNLGISIEDRTLGIEWDSLIAEMRAIPPDEMAVPLDAKMLTQLKFSDCLPENLATKELQSRLTDQRACAKILDQKLNIVHIVADSV